MQIIIWVFDKYIIVWIIEKIWLDQRKIEGNDIDKKRYKKIKQGFYRWIYIDLRWRRNLRG
jgi:hypothetical protein